MARTLFNLIILFSSGIVISTVVGFLNRKYLNSPTMKIILYYALVSTLFGIVITTLSLKRMNNMVFVSIFSLLEFLMLTSAYYFTIHKKTLYLKIAFGVIAIGIISSTIIHLVNSYHTYDRITKSASAIILIIISIFYLISQFVISNQHKEDKPMKVISIGVFMHFSSSFLVFVLGSDNGILTKMEIIWLYLINSIFYLLFTITLLIAFIQCKKQSGHLN